MSDYADYDAILEKIENAKTDTDAQYKRISDNSTSICDINNNISAANIAVVRNQGGDIIGYDYVYTYPNQPNTNDLAINSNSDTGIYGTATGGGGYTKGGGAGRFPGSYYSTGGDMESGARDSNDNPVNAVSGYISPEWAAVSALSKFGRNAATEAADLMLDVSDDVREFFSDLLVSSGEFTDAIRAIYGIDDNGNTTMYLDEDTLGAMAIALRDRGALDDSVIEWEYDNPDDCGEYYLPLQIKFGTDVYLGFDNRIPITTGDLSRAYISEGNGLLACICDPYSRYRCMIVGISLTPFSVTHGRYRTDIESYLSTQTTAATLRYTANNTPFYGIDCEWSDGYYISADRCYPMLYYLKPVSTTFAHIVQALATIVFDGTSHSSEMPEGISPQPISTNPYDAIVGDDPHTVAQSLVTNYPAIMGNPIQITVLDDSCNEVVKNYYSVPISYSPTNVTGGNSITGGLQINPSFNPDVVLDLPDIDMSKYVEEVINQLYGTGAGREVTTTVPDPTTETGMVVLPLMPFVPDTGTGVAPLWNFDEVVGNNILWKVYNPSPTVLFNFGMWLWTTPDLVTLFKKVMNNPMDAILGLHKVYVTPNHGSDASIVCGNLDSGISSKTVNNNYVEVDCGSVWVTEYFGNVFDYSPFTEISIYLPFIGIMPLSIDDIMRGEICVKYTVDVYTGACIAEVSVNRDGVGGVLYQFNGNAAVEYPITAMSYNAALSATISIASGVVGSIPQFASGNILGGSMSLASGGIGAAAGARNKISRSGSFSGNAGAMGSKIPYLIITRPQPEIAQSAESFNGLGANSVSEIGSLHGYFRARFVTLEIPSAFKSEIDEISMLLQSGIYV